MAEQTRDGKLRLDRSLLGLTALFFLLMNVEQIVALHSVQLVAVGGSFLLVRLNGIRLVRIGECAADMGGDVDYPENME